ncbi:hypothetical protein BOTCAL_0368g00070 [Botryotinia calthae]|uniref:Uncharacterized protein n=1 Tax=Botryotinia calthae TaxID=38488 RepID=A0A4Y8CSP1_9HELO|nr:hypothetical protein BOTCAL_0368g00070 [Botryotinia calthae]
MYTLPKDTCEYLQYGANALCRVENFITAVPGFNSLLRGMKLVSIVSQLVNGHMVLFKDKLKIDTLLFSEVTAYIVCNNVTMGHSVKLSEFTNPREGSFQYIELDARTSGASPSLATSLFDTGTY